MLNTVYQLVAPRRFEIAIRDEVVGSHDLIVRPTHMSICNADQRYYQGARDVRVLAEKLPMALIHESIGEVVEDRAGYFNPGDFVVMIPNLPTESNRFIHENYLRSSKFRSSSADGFMQELVVTNHDRVVQLPVGIDKDVAAFTELVSVMVHVIGRFNSFSHEDRECVGFWGDGNLGFIGSLLFKKLYPDSKVIVFGHSQDKLADFTFVDETYITSDVPEGMSVSHAVECAGGMGSASAVEQIIDRIRPEGTIALCGVSENPIPVNTRMVLEKGLRLYGSSRSGREDFTKTLELFGSMPTLVDYLKRIVGQTVAVQSVADIAVAFEVDIQKRFGKTVIHWEI